MEITIDNLVTTFKASGLTQEAFCKAHGITLEKLRYHLYKKKGREISSRRPNTAPAFISFNKADNGSSETVHKTNANITIIHGKFTLKQLATFISELDRTC